jgi:hypothetical protein
MIRLERNDKFKFSCGKHIGRIYTVLDFAPDGSGKSHAVCEYSDSDKVRIQLFTEEDLERCDGAFQMWDTSARENVVDIFNHLGKSARSKEEIQ